MLKSVVGTALYVAPEGFIKHKYNLFNYVV